MVKLFTSWLEGVVEDDPLFEEIDIIVFNTRFNGKYKYLELKGYEKYIFDNAIAFSPLEAQFFDCADLSKMNESKFCFNAKYLIEESFSSDNLKREFNNRKIYFKYKQKLEYLFDIKFE